MEEQRVALMSQIEAAMVSLVQQFAEYSGKRLKLHVTEDEAHKMFFYLPARLKKLAHDLSALSQVHALLKNNQSSTKRDLYYDRKALYGVQNKFDRSLTNICELLNCSRADLHVFSCSKGLVRGAISFLPQSGSIVDCREQAVLIAECLMEMRPVNEAHFILVVEKEATFQKLVDSCFFQVFPKSILVTGKGYPDICTRLVLRWLVERLGIPIFGLFDGDPHGIEIYLTYKYGAIAEKSESRNAFIRDIRWIGLKPSHAPSIRIADDQFLAMKNRDYVKIVRVRRRAIGLSEHDVVAELDILRERRTKLELEALSSISKDYLPRSYLLPQISPFLPSQ